MALVGYSDSEGSDSESIPSAPQPPPEKSAPASSSAASVATPSASKPGFQKVVDRANPHKIRVSLPATDKPSDRDGGKEDDGPPAKKPRIGGGVGFNAMLPAPKQPKQAKSGTANGGRLGGGSAGGKGIGRGVSLKTGAAPAFSREPISVEDLAATGQDERRNDGAGNGSAGPTVESQDKKRDEQEVKLTGKPMMFKPLSVARKSQKKKARAIAPSYESAAVSKRSEVATLAGSTDMSTSKPEPKPATKPKVSLFSISHDEPSSTISTKHKLSLPKPEFSEVDDDEVEIGGTAMAAPAFEAPQPQPSTNDPNSLTSVAADLNLTPAQRRQLFGRAGASPSFDPSGLKVVNFNTDEEYRANEARRQAGELATEQHQPVRTIAPGKHTLRQLVSAATSNKEALEEQFAAGKRNKKEAGGKYGW
ncbi:mitotic checkpoint regulator, MAD2B-interacting-domain-containing protein [Lineolata rhizophorae]|uniref:Mitotic checkpoint regulator, MAD2B-interacting-domain-containing protein n=1 Tax=Lineolata rhizophorae TaxID=578093 RepID=A0A6A6NYB1_9PEZI|nr:mitotic checkpoint regulator, MAD2B-interacting-domain-containing protein [Lineolata rhizophorae]